MSIFGGKKPKTYDPFDAEDQQALRSMGIGVSDNTGGLLSGTFGAAQQAQLSRDYLGRLKEEMLAQKLSDVWIPKPSPCLMSWREVEGGYLVKYSTREGEVGKEVLCATLDDVSKIVFRAAAEKALA